MKINITTIPDLNEKNTAIILNLKKKLHQKYYAVFTKQFTTLNNTNTMRFFFMKDKKKKKKKKRS